MRINDVVYFSPDLRIVDVDFNDRPRILNAIQSRIEEYYLAPARMLNANNMAFAAGVMLLSAIDAIAYYSIPRNKSNSRIEALISQLDGVGRFPNPQSISSKICLNFRNGLIHEGRVKNGCQFAYNYPELLWQEHDFLILNPALLFQSISEYFEGFMNVLRRDLASYEQFSERLQRQFLNEVEQLKMAYPD